MPERVDSRELEQLLQDTLLQNELAEELLEEWRESLPPWANLEGDLKQFQRRLKHVRKELASPRTSYRYRAELQTEELTLIVEIKRLDADILRMKRAAGV